jgi:hypothetical protein
MIAEDHHVVCRKKKDKVNRNRLSSWILLAGLALLGHSACISEVVMENEDEENVAVYDFHKDDMPEPENLYADCDKDKNNTEETKLGTTQNCSKCGEQCGEFDGEPIPCNWNGTPGVHKHFCGYLID